MWKLKILDRKVKREDFAENQPICIKTGIYDGVALFLLPLEFLKQIGGRCYFGSDSLDTEWSWKANEWEAKKLNVRDIPDGWRGRWLEEKRSVEEFTKILEKIKGNYKTTGRGPMTCDNCKTKWGWYESAPNSAYNDLSCPVCGRDC